LGGSNPKLVVVDEGGLAMAENQLFASEIADYALALRKLEAVLVLATQSLTHFDNPTAAAIWDQLGNKVFMPHAEAMRPESFQRYLAKGLQEEQVRALAHAQPKGEVLLQTRHVTRLISVRLEDDALAICGAIGPEHQARAFDLLRQGVKPGSDFTAAWLSETTAEWSVRSQAWRQAA
jgi:type IV secretory pathway VirB4 component